MSIIDIGIIVLIICGGLLGFKRGFTRQVVSFVGLILTVIIAYLLKNPLANIFFEYLPFFKFGGILKGVTALNILVYEILAFIIVLSLLQIIIRILALVTNIFEKILTATIILGIPSKILGMFLGFVENFIFVFVLLFFISLPFFNLDLLDKSKFAKGILYHTPVLSNIAHDTVLVIDEFSDLKKKYEHTTNANAFNLDTIDLFLKYDIVTPDSIEHLIKKNKLNVTGIEDVLNKYRRK